MSEIMKRLVEIRDSDDGRNQGYTMGVGPHDWEIVRNGEFGDGSELDMTPAQAGRELADLIRDSKVILHVGKHGLQLELP